jgi:apolipoprotein N-acyltransferase
MRRRSRLALGILATVISAAAFYLSTGLGTFWPLAWLAPLPVLITSSERSWPGATSIAFMAFFLGSINTPYGLPGWILFGFPPAVAFAVATLAFGVAARRRAAWLAIFVFPAVLTAYEFVFALISPNGTLWSLAYSQTDFLPLLQVVSLTGLWGVVFVVSLVPSAAAMAWQRRSVSLVVPPLVITLAVIGYGSVRLRDSSASAGVRVGLAATDRGLPQAAITTDTTIALGTAKAYAIRIAHLAAEGAEIVVLPEKMVGITPESDGPVMDVFDEAARAARVKVIAGFSRNAVQPRRNVARVFSSEGGPNLEYEKRHPVPIIERDYARGNAPTFFAGPGAQWGVAICKDLDFPDWLRGYGERDVRFLAVPAWDFVDDARLHSRMAVVRGVENGFTIARSAQGGFVTVSDSYGRIVAEQSSATDPLIVVAAPPGTGRTFYARFGDWFGWINVFAACACMIGITATGRKVPRAPAGTALEPAAR